ncbi:MAG: DUF4867 family protein [Saccharofermentans sp.]|nr:DUF4867 family protein [Saccharofermentans sp.]
MEIIKSSDKRLKKYGRMVDNVDLTSVLVEMDKTAIPEGVVYEPSLDNLEATASFADLRRVGFGESDIQLGHCIGKNTLLNALEYHRGSEINVFDTDAVLILGKREDIEDDNTYDTSKCEAFLFEKGTAVELYATTLHYAPCTAPGNEGFKVGVVLPRGTNYPLEGSHRPVADGNATEDALLTATNKWLIAHPDAAGEAGHFMGLKGENLDISK